MKKLDALANAVMKLQDDAKKLSARADSLGRTDASFPQQVKYKGKDYFATGKKGKNRQSGEESAEYEYRDKNDSESRIWRTASGKIFED